MAGSLRRVPRSPSSFRKGYSDADIAALVYYVTCWFGARAATITPDQVAGRREEE
ncbi:MAG: hypothetical protein ACREX3_11000 [Gammaproteobacteria bacterium]